MNETSDIPGTKAAGEAEGLRRFGPGTEALLAQLGRREPSGEPPLWRVAARRVSWWLRGRALCRWHVVHTGLPPRWHDVDDVMFEACFALLARFVEGELGRASVDEDSQHKGYRMERVNGTDQAAIDLYYWHQVELPRLVREDEKSSALTRKFGYNHVETLKQQKLLDLVRIRRNLWT